MTFFSWFKMVAGVLLLALLVTKSFFILFIVLKIRGNRYQ